MWCVLLLLLSLSLPGVGEVDSMQLHPPHAFIAVYQDSLHQSRSLRWSWANLADSPVALGRRKANRSHFQGKLARLLHNNDNARLDCCRPPTHTPGSWGATTATTHQTSHGKIACKTDRQTWGTRAPSFFFVSTICYIPLHCPLHLHSTQSL